MKNRNDSSYTDLKKITDKIYKQLSQMSKHIDYSKDVLQLFNKFNIRIRNKDGNLTQCTISIPKTLKDAIVVGLRYLKNDKSKSEDLFLFRKDKPIFKGYRGKLERILTEYKGSHKLNR